MSTLLRVCMLCAAGVKEAEQEQPSAPEAAKVRLRVIQDTYTAAVAWISTLGQSASLLLLPQGGHS